MNVSTIMRAVKSFGVNLLGRGYSWIGSALYIASAGRIDWSAKAGLRIDNSGIWAILTYIVNQSIQDPQFIVQKRPNGKAKAKWIEDTSALANKLVAAIHDGESGYYAPQLIAHAILSMGYCGNGYWYKYRSESGNVIGFVPIVPDRVTAKRDRDFQGPNSWHELKRADGIRPITYYEVRGGDGQVLEIPVEDIIHFRYMVDMSEPAQGVSPFWAVLREIVLDNESSTLNASLVMNGGILGWAWSPSKNDDALPPGQAKDAEDKVFNAIRGAGAKGGVFMPYSGTFAKVGFSPDEMGITKMRADSIARFCAQMNVDPMVVGLPSDNKTYSNFEEADEQGMRKAVLPIMRVIVDTITTQCGRQDFNLSRSQRAGWDLSEVPALQPDQDKVHDRTRKDWVAGLIDRAEAREETGRSAKPGDSGLFYSDIKAKNTSKTLDEDKAKKPDERSMLQRFRELEEIHA